MNSLKQKVFFSSTLGSIVAWYDFIIFGMATALIFSKLFFPGMMFIIPILVFAIGFAIRPLGSIAFGHLGDKFGRRNTMVWTLYLTGISTVLIGLLPTFDSIGIWAPVLLILLRITQTFALGGEWASSATMLVEYNVESPKRGFIASIVSSSYMISALAAAGIFALVTSFGDQFFVTYGWRIPFLLSSVLLLVGVYMRTKILETPIFDKEKQNQVAFPFKEVVTKHWKTVLLGACAYAISGATMYVVTIFGFGYVINAKLISRPELTQIYTAFFPVWFVAAALFGYLSDKMPKIRMFQLNAIAALVLAYPIFYWLSVGNLFWPLLAMVVISMPTFATAPGYFAELFPTALRQTGAGVTYALALLIGGAASPLVVQWVFSLTNNIQSLTYIFVALSALSITASLYLPKDKAVLTST